MEGTEQLAHLLRALGDPSRLRLLHALEQGELTVGEITEVTGLSQPRVSRHLKLLCDARVLRRARDQNEVYYRANTDEDRRALVRHALEALSPEDPAVVQDQARLRIILDKRSTRADELLGDLGIKVLDSATVRDVAATIEALLGELQDEDPAGVASLGRVLDVGTGTGTMMQLLADRAEHIVAVDRSREMRLVARAGVLASGLANCTVQDGDMYALGFPVASFDTVTMDRVLGVADRGRDVVAEATRVLRPGGHLLIVETQLSTIDEKILVGWLTATGLEVAALSRTADNVACIALARKPVTAAHATV
jgi:DNA-binding transcriptional ArsR family regulator/precorrin-6B methylase 2